MLKGQKHTEVTKEKLRLVHTGKKHTDETKRRISDSRKGIKYTKETNEKRKSLRTKEWTKERRKAMSERLKEKHPFKGKKHTDATRRKMSESAILRWQRQSELQYNGEFD